MTALTGYLLKRTAIPDVRWRHVSESDSFLKFEDDAGRSCIGYLLETLSVELNKIQVDDILNKRWYVNFNERE